MAYEMNEQEMEKFHDEQYPQEWLGEDFKRKGWKSTNSVVKEVTSSNEKSSF